MEKIKIKVTKRYADYHACIDGQEGFWGCGKSVDEAIGSVILSNAAKFGLNIETPYKKYDRELEG
jgi:hypothetical protein